MYGIALVFLKSGGYETKNYVRSHAYKCDNDIKFKKNLGKKTDKMANVRMAGKCRRLHQ